MSEPIKAIACDANQPSGRPTGSNPFDFLMVMALRDAFL